MFQLPLNRQLKRLGEIAKTQSGGTPSRDKSEFWGGDVVWLKSGELSDNLNITEYTETITQAGVEGSSAKVFNKGTLIMAMYGATAGKLGILGMDAATNQAVCSIQNTKGLFDPKYIYYFLFKERENIIRDSFGGAQPNISKGYIDNILIPLPPLPVQHAIVDALDHASAQITASHTAIQSQLDALDQLWQSTLSEAMGNNIGTPTKLGSLCDFVRGPFGGSLKKEIFKPDGYAIYEQQHAIYNQFSEIRYFIDEDKFNEMKRFELKTGDLIMSCSGTMGKIAIVPEGIKQGIINQALLKLTPGEKINSRFLKLWTQSENFQNSLQEYSQGAAIQNVASVAILKQIQIPLPDLATQSSIVSHLDDVSQHISLLRQQYLTQLQSYDDLWASILDQAFRGELVRE